MITTASSRETRRTGRRWRCGSPCGEGPGELHPPNKYPVVHQAALAACDAHDGLKDGLIDDPTQCSFDPAVLLCKGGDGPSCLTAPQVTRRKRSTLRPVNPRTGKQLSTPLVPGTELGWGEAPAPNRTPTSSISIDTSCSKIPSGTGRPSTSTVMRHEATCRKISS